MFFIMGITNGQKEINYSENGMNICKKCGAYCSYSIFMTFFCLSLFFIPVLRWGKKYYVRTSCCDSLYELDSIAGKKIARGEDVTIRDEDLKELYSNKKKCQSCGYIAEADFEFCPKCGERL